MRTIVFALPLPLPLLLVPVVAEAVVTGLALVVARQAAAGRDELLSILAGLGLAIPILGFVAIWLWRDHFALRRESQTMHAQNIEKFATVATKVDRVISIVEDPEGLLADRTVNRERRHLHGGEIQALWVHLYALEAWAQEVAKEQGIRYHPPPTDIRFRRRQGEQGHGG